MYDEHAADVEEALAERDSRPRLPRQRSLYDSWPALRLGTDWVEPSSDHNFLVGDLVKSAHSSAGRGVVGRVLRVRSNTVSVRFYLDEECTEPAELVKNCCYHWPRSERFRLRFYTGPLACVVNRRFAAHSSLLVRKRDTLGGLDELYSSSSSLSSLEFEQFAQLVQQRAASSSSTDPEVLAQSARSTPRMVEAQPIPGASGVLVAENEALEQATRRIPQRTQALGRSGMLHESGALPESFGTAMEVSQGPFDAEYENDKEQVTNLLSRFPILTDDEVMRALERNKGHAGTATVELNELAERREKEEDEKRLREGQAWDELERRWCSALDDSSVSDERSDEGEDALPTETCDELEARLLSKLAGVEERPAGQRVAALEDTAARTAEADGAASVSALDVPPPAEGATEPSRLPAMPADEPQYSSEEHGTYKTTSSGPNEQC